MGMRLLLGVVLVAACSGDPRTSSSVSPEAMRRTIDKAATVCGSASTVDGIDVSEYDDAVDWPTAKAAGIAFAFARVSDGLDFPDPRFAEYWSGARADGVIRGAY